MDLILRSILISNKKIYIQWIFTVYKEKMIGWSALHRLEIYFKGLKLKLVQAQRHCSY